MHSVHVHGVSGADRCGNHHGFPGSTTSSTLSLRLSETVKSMRQGLDICNEPSVTINFLKPPNWMHIFQTKLGRGWRTILSQNPGIAWMGGSDPCLDFFEGFVHIHRGPSKVIIYHQKMIIPHKSVPFSQEKIIQPHLFNISFLHSLSYQKFQIF